MISWDVGTNISQQPDALISRGDDVMSTKKRRLLQNIGPIYQVTFIYKITWCYNKESYYMNNHCCVNFKTLSL
jgi:hypothetical protein